MACASGDSSLRLEKRAADVDERVVEPHELQLAVVAPAPVVAAEEGEADADGILSLDVVVARGAMIFRVDLSRTTSAPRDLRAR